MSRELITAEQIDAAYRDVWSTVPHAHRLSAFARKIAEQAVKQEREARWQSMEYAPRDQQVLLTDGHTVGEGFWHDGSECYGHRGGEGWFWESDRANLLIASNAEPTGWMPLPDAAIRARSQEGNGAVK